MKTTRVRDNEAAKCNCPRQCRQLTYEPTISQAPLADSAASVIGGDDINQSVEEIINDRCIVEVSPPEKYLSAISIKFLVTE